MSRHGTRPCLAAHRTACYNPASRMGAERCESGRIDMLGKHASRQRDRGFESHPLRHTNSVECWVLSPELLQVRTNCSSPCSLSALATSLSTQD